MTDIAFRLRTQRPDYSMLIDAANEIERLRGTRAALRTDIANLHTLMESLRDDAARWRYVRDNLLHAHSLHMDGTSAFSFSFPGRGRTIDEVIDRLIAEQGKNHN